MNGIGHGPSRRAMLVSVGGLALAAALAAVSRAQAAGPRLERAIPSTGERLPVIGMGSWITFNVGDDPALRAIRARVLQAFFDHGGTVIDSSPMYGSSEAVIGHCLARVDGGDRVFAATKVWTPLVSRGPAQMAASERLWGGRRFDVMQVHNLLAWEGHLETLGQWRAEERVRYVGITTSHGSRHAAFLDIMAAKPIDFVQFTYNIADREAERRLLPMAAERGLAVLVNRPFRRGQLIDAVAGRPLPGWAAEIGCENWPQVLLKFIVSHPAVTCAIPATSRVDHMLENMGAGYGPLPDAALRRRMANDFAKL